MIKIEYSYLDSVERISDLYILLDEEGYNDQQIGAMISEDQLDLVIFLRDPLAAQPHEPDVTALIRLSDVYDIPLATNIGTAEVLLRGLEAGFLDFRKVIHEKENRTLTVE